MIPAAMIIAVDDVIPYWREAFAPLGELRPFAARTVSSRDLQDVDAVIVRSVTRAGPALLDGTGVRFVGTASVGMDNLDEPYLRARGIDYSNAAGCNANSVAEYVTAALMRAAARRSWRLAGMSLGIVGAGHVGTAVERKALALGMSVVACDPPLAEATGDPRYRPLDEVLAADIVTLHVPLTRTGPHATWHLFDRDVIGRLGPRQLLINAARGPVVESGAIHEALAGGRLAGAVLDVWEDEPRIRYDLLERVELGTPHIAGYSLDGKVRCTEMMAEAVGRRFGVEPSWRPDGVFPAARRIPLPEDLPTQDVVAAAVAGAYDIEVDDRSLRALASLPVEEAGVRFDRLRNEYAYRPEFRHYTVEPPRGSAARPLLEALGFGVE
jgi:erythronate-4-phosphate dehydrogenase